VNENGANSFFASKKVIITMLGQAAVAALGYMAVNDPNSRHQMIYGAMVAAFTALSGVYVHTEGKIDAAAVKKPLADAENVSAQVIDTGSDGNIDMERAG
jgi:hypothetical protein